LSYDQDFVVEPAGIAGAKRLGSRSGSSSGASPADANSYSETIEATAAHPIWVVGKGWIDAGALVIGDKLLAKDGSYLTVTKLGLVKKQVRVYNFEVAKLHTYFVGEQQWLTHNCEANVPGHPSSHSAVLGRRIISAVSPRPARPAAHDAHHIIPSDFRDGHGSQHRFVMRAIRGGWFNDGARNGILLPSNQNIQNGLPFHVNNHTRYSDQIERDLNWLERQAQRRRWTNAQANDMLGRYADYVRGHIVNGGNIDLNDLIIPRLRRMSQI
jgi:hypothetical protein